MAARPSTAKTPAPPGENVDVLKRKLKQLESDHKEWQEQVQKDLRRQRLEIDQLQRENEQSKQDLNKLRATETTTATADGSLRNPHSKSAKRSKELDFKRDTLFRLESSIRNEEARLREIDRQIDDTRGNIRYSRRTMGGVNVTQESYDAINRQIAVLENRLDQSLVQFNDALRQNKELRDTIDTLRGERDVFQAIYEKLEAELQEKKKEMAFIIEVSNIAYEERDNNLQVLANLKAFAKEEMHSFEETLKELDGLLEEDRKMKENVKQRIAQLQQKDKFDDVNEKPTLAGKRRSPVQNQQRQQQQDNKDSSVPAQLQLYEDAFLKIRKATDIPDLNELVKRFLHSEEDNFSLFSYVNDLSKEIEVLEKERLELLNEIEKISVGNEADQERRMKLKNLEDRLRQEEKKTQRYIDLSLKTEGVLRGVMTSVESVFSRLDCDESIILEKHGVSGLTLESLLLFLASIELKSDEFLTSWSKQNGALVDGFGGPRGPQVAFNSVQVLVDPKRLPGTGEDAEGSDDDDHPLSREDLLKKAQRKLNAQALQASAQGRPVRGGKGKSGSSLVKK